MGRANFLFAYTMGKNYFVLPVLFFLSVFTSYSQTATVVLRVADAKTVINKNIYGHFAEHLGHCIYDGLYVGDSNQVIPNTAGVRNDIIDALKKSNHKWVIPDHEKFHDFIVSFSLAFTPPAAGAPSPQKGVYNFYLKRKPILSTNQVPLDNVTLLPTVAVNYKIDE